MAYQRGNIVLVQFPFSDLSTSKARPAVIVSGTLYSREQPDLLLAALTTNLSANDTLDYILQDWRIGGLRFPTAFKPVIATLEPSLIVFTIGQMTGRDLTEIEARLRKALEL